MGTMADDSHPCVPEEEIPRSVSFGQSISVLLGGGWEGWPSYLRNELWTQLRAVGPVSAFLFLLPLFLLRHLPQGAGGIALALAAVAIGLQSFMFGLFHGLLPLGDRLGMEMPRHLPLAPILLIAFVMGVLVTYAEPALGVVQTLASLIEDKGQAPYVVWLLSAQGKPYVTLAVAVGVGLAVVVGLLRIHHNLRLTPIIFGTVFVTLSLTMYVDFCTDKSEVVALAWDLGAITTGPVTVPMVLAIGMGLTKGMGREPSPDQSFGIVTLASLMPVNTVLAFALTLDRASLAPRGGPAAAPDAAAFGPGVVLDDAVGATQAVVPLIAFVFLVLHLLKQPINGRPIRVRRTSHGVDDPPPEPAPQPRFRNPLGGDSRPRGFAEASPSAPGPHSPTPPQPDELTPLLALAQPDTPPPPALDFDCLTLPQPPAQPDSAPPSRPPSRTASRLYSATLPQYHNTAEFRAQHPEVHGNLALLWVWLGLVLFALGMRYGLNALGDRAGAALPATFTRLPGVAGSPFYGVAAGVLLSAAAAFLMGFGATLAEPALAAMAVTVEDLTHDGMSVQQVVLSVALGVGAGLGLGVLKLIYRMPLAPLLYACYAVGLALTACSDDNVVNLAWDSGGVTTDAITVPMVMSLGLGFGGALHHSDSFGLLTLASVCPIISVLLCALLCQGKKRALPR